MSIFKPPPEPWHAFLQELDAALNEPVRLECMGGFVITQLYGLDRPTADIDVYNLGPRKPAEIVSALGALGGPLYQKYNVYIDCNAFVASAPYDYEDRLIELFPGCYRHLRIMAFELYDLALSKLERNIQKDRDDVRFLARRPDFDLAELHRRYSVEMRWQMAVPEREDLTLRLWIRMINDDRAALSK